MARRPATAAEIVGALLVTAVLCLSLAAAWRSGAYLGVAVLALLVLLLLWGVVDMLRQGLRAPTAFERFERRHFMRFVVILAGGVVASVLLKRAGYDTWAIAVLAMFLAASLWSARALRGRDETSAGYKARMGYRDPEQQTHPDSDQS